MALSMYVGPPGSGKSYEAVFAVLIPAFKAGRTIITNIKGVDPEYWADNIEPDKGGSLGSIRKVDSRFFHDEMNYPLMDDDGHAVEAGAITPGCLVVVDEAWEVFPPGAESGVTKRIIGYFRTHRHLVDDKGVGSDIVLITQDVMSIHARIRTVTEFCIAVRNMRFLGLGGRYRSEVYTNWKMTGSSRLGMTVRKYNKKVFAFYKSFQAEGAAKVVLTDKSHRVFKWYHMLFVLALIGAAIWAGLRVPGTYAGMKDGKPVTKMDALLAKKECQGSGILVDLTDRRAFYEGQWRKLDASAAGPDGRTRWDVGPCFITFSA
jgi:zona occludens toxin